MHANPLSLVATFAVSVTQPPLSWFFDGGEFWPLIDLLGSAAHKKNNICNEPNEQAQEVKVQGDWTGYRTGNGEKLSSSQAEPGQAIKSAVA